MVKRREKSGLGRGLSALMADIETTRPAAPAEDAAAPAPRGPRLIPIETIRPNPEQPRRFFSEEALQELSASIAEKGIIQPLILRVDPNDAAAYQIVAGERRWRAAQKANLHEVPALVREFSDVEVFEVAIIENIQRADLNALEEAHGYKQLMDRFGHTQEQLSSAMGKSRSHIANLMRLLTLPESIQGMVRDGRLSSGHARALITATEPEALAREAVEKGLSVREVEKRAKAGPANASNAKAAKPGKDADTLALEGDLSAGLGMPVSIDHDADSGGGRVTVRYKDLVALDDLIRRLGGS